MDRFEELRKAQEGTLQQGISSPEDETRVSSIPMGIEDEIVSPMSNEVKRAKILNMILLVMVFAMVGLFAYLFFTDRLILGVENPFSKQVVEEDQEITENEDEMPVVQMKEYLNTEFGVKFTYPESWVVQENIEMGDLYLEIKERVVDPDFVFVYDLPTVAGYESCYYMDTENPEEIAFGTLYDNFFSINADSSLRRSLLDNADSGVSGYIVCKKGEEGYSEYMQPGRVEYRVNMDRPDVQSMLTIMDNILLSFEYTGEMP